MIKTSSPAFWNYIDAISRDIGWLGIFRVFVSRHLSPLEELQRLSPILRSVGYDVVVVIEDVDRNGRNFDLSDIQALLARFKEVDGVSFVLTIANEQQVDFARICEFIEVVPTLDQEQTLRLIHRVRAMCLNRFDDLLPDAPAALTADDDRYSVASIFFGDFRYWQHALASLISNPRVLKFTLRRLVAAWQDLHGEVNIDLLLISSALRSAASPAFSFLVENYDRIRSAEKTLKSSDAIEAQREKPAEELRADWDRLLSKNVIDLRNVSVLILQLLPESTVFLDANTHTQPKRQPRRRVREKSCERNVTAVRVSRSNRFKLMKAADDQKGLARNLQRPWTDRKKRATRSSTSFLYSKTFRSCDCFPRFTQ
ncbi:MAG: hypothetical protein H0U99_04850 [Chthoniobacterales bacterium]|nr:hypothetical protein [Chthoniobacterales bacterium]